MVTIWFFNWYQSKVTSSNHPSWCWGNCWPLWGLHHHLIRENATGRGLVILPVIKEIKLLHAYPSKRSKVTENYKKGLNWVEDLDAEMVEWDLIKHIREDSFQFQSLWIDIKSPRISKDAIDLKCYKLHLITAIFTARNTKIAKEFVILRAKTSIITIYKPMICSLSPPWRYQVLILLPFHSL